MLNAENVFLVGPMGSGKSAVGRQLAARLGLEFVDSDAEIEAVTGVDIAYIFERDEGGADAWGLVKKLAAVNGVAGDAFGDSVSVSGDWIVAGARGRSEGQRRGLPV